ncbi:MAG: SRPBCC domain-containing protein [Candidatus Thermoplasmatota archaeon]|jgi:uncharacterized protein YndB with AHSA1/START domain
MASKKTLTFERTFQAPLEDIWDLWTTKEGIESWRGPDGFSVKVQAIDLRPGGALEYTMTATGAAQVEFMQAAGMPVATKNRGTYVEVTPRRRLVYTHLADFIPDVEPYEIAHVVELHEAPQGVRMVLTVDAMHSLNWSKLMEMGWQSELDNLAKVVVA